jgi:hypothetical protein
VIVPNRLHGTPVFKENVESHCLTSICAISLAGDVICPGRITKRGTHHPDGSQCFYFDKTRRYRTIISPSIISSRERIGPDPRAIVIFDDQKAHLHAALNAWAVADNIVLSALPPNSEHLPQPLD